MRPHILRQRLARARLGDRARRQPVGPAQRYILGEEGSGALCRPALWEGTLYTKNAAT